jgi:preprotein translocase subunit YajC
MFEMISDFIVSPAWAMAPPQDGAGGPMGAFMSFAPLIFLFAIFYFLLIRPQQKKAKAVQSMQDDIKKGDKVITSGGIYGLVDSVGNNTVTLKVGENKIKFGKAYILEVRSSDED